MNVVEMVHMEALEMRDRAARIVEARRTGLAAAEKLLADAERHVTATERSVRIWDEIGLQ